MNGVTTRKEYFATNIMDYLTELNKININTQAGEFSSAEYREYLAEWDDILKSLRDYSTEFAKENLK